MKKYVLWVLFGTLLIDMIGIGMLIPIIPIIFTDPSSPAFLLEGYSVTAQYVLAGLLTALFGLMQFIAAPILGELSDVYGRKRLLIIGVTALALSHLCFGFGLETGSLIILFASRIIAGIAAGNFSIAQASIADVTPPEKRAKNFGIIGAAAGTGFIIGPLLGGWLSSAFHDVAAPFWFATALGMVNFLFLSLLFRETHVDKKAEHNFHFLKGIHNIQAAWRDHDARPVYISSFFHVCGFSFFMSFIGILLVVRFGLSEASIGTFFGAVGAWIIFTQMVVLRIITRHFRERQILHYSLPALAFGLLLYPFLPSAVWIYALIPLIAIPNGLSIANMASLVSKSVSAQRQGAALGINGSLMALAHGTIPLLAGFGSGIFGVALPFLAGGLLVITSWFMLFKRKGV